MSKSKWGGARLKQSDDDQRGGARPRAGRKQVRFRFGNIGDSFVIERGMVNDVPGPPEIWEIANVTDDFFEMQVKRGDTTEIMTISKIDFWNGQ
jgi:hypothetical protein